MARANGSPPGNMVLWRGLARFTDTCLGYTPRSELTGNCKDHRALTAVQAFASKPGPSCRQASSPRLAISDKRQVPSPCLLDSVRMATGIS